MKAKPTYEELTAKVKELEAAVSEHKDTAKKLQDRERKLRYLIETTNDLVWEIDLNGVYTYAGPSVKDLLGYDIDELIGTTIFDSVAHEEKERTRGFFTDRCKKPESFSGRIVTLLHKDSRQVIVEISGTPLFDDNGKLLGWCGFDKDVTARERAEESLLESEKRYRNLFENAQAGVFRATLDGSRFLAVNKKFPEILGYSAEEMLTKVIPFNLLHQDKRHRVLQRLTDEGILEDYELEMLTKNGKTKTCLSSIRLFREEEYLEGTVIDITGRKKAEAELQKAHAELVRSNELLHKEIEERRHMEKALREREEDLRTKAYDLQEANIALKVLLKHREEDRHKIEEQVSLNVKKLVEPYLECLNKSGLSSTQQTYFNILQSNLHEIISPFTRKLSSEFSGLTLTEMKVANLVKLGKTTKEIADLTRVSEKTVEHHRESIRQKLGIKKKKINLGTHLLSFS